VRLSASTDTKTNARHGSARYGKKPRDFFRETLRKNWLPNADKSMLNEGGERVPFLGKLYCFVGVHLDSALTRRKGCLRLFPQGTPCAEYIITIPFWPTTYSPMGSKPLLCWTASAKLENTPSMSSRLDQTTKTVWALTLPLPSDATGRGLLQY
jgi:hypothetical protein